ncbi:MAG TPA: hypothetical protein VIO36_03755 [Anaerolineaceae bacterium]
MDTKSLPLMGRLPAFSSRTTLEGWQLTAARVVWALVTLLIFSLFVLGVPSDYSQQLKSASTEFSAALGQLGLEPVFLAVYRTAMNLLLAILFLTAGIFVFVRKSDDWMVMLTSLACSGFVVLFLPTLVRLMDAHPEFTLPVAFSRAFGLGSSLIVFYYLFPDGRFVPGWLKYFMFAWLAMVVVWFIFPDAPFNLVYLYTWYNNLGPSFVVYILWFGSGVAAQIYRYLRVSNSLQRQQTKWVVFGTTGAFLGFFLYYLIPVMFRSVYQPGLLRLVHIFIGVPVFHLLVLMVPVTISFAILRFRLWEIDFIINRSLVYVILSSTLLVVYFTIVTLMTLFFQSFTGTRQSEIVLVSSTLLTASLFSPLRSRLQYIIDRRFYRNKYNASRALEAFGATVRDEVDLNRMSESLVQVIKETIQPESISLWLNTPARSAPEERQPPQVQAFVKNLGISWDDLRDNNLDGG